MQMRRLPGFVCTKCVLLLYGMEVERCGGHPDPARYYVSSGRGFGGWGFGVTSPNRFGTSRVVPCVHAVSSVCVIVCAEVVW